VIADKQKKINKVIEENKKRKANVIIPNNSFNAKTKNLIERTNNIDNDKVILLNTNKSYINGSEANKVNINNSNTNTMNNYFKPSTTITTVTNHVNQTNLINGNQTINNTYIKNVNININKNINVNTANINNNQDKNNDDEKISDSITDLLNDIDPEQLFQSNLEVNESIIENKENNNSDQIMNIQNNISSNQYFSYSTHMNNSINNSNNSNAELSLLDQEIKSCVDSINHNTQNKDNRDSNLITPNVSEPKTPSKSKLSSEEIFNILKDYKNLNGEEDLKKILNFHNILDPIKKEEELKKSGLKPMYVKNVLECPICFSPAM